MGILIIPGVLLCVAAIGMLALDVPGWSRRAWGLGLLGGILIGLSVAR